VNCHGVDGKGRSEGGVTPSDISRSTLTRPYGVEHPSGRKAVAYTNDHLIVRAITMGIDSAGNPLAVAMPRFQLSLAQAQDLVAYVKRLGNLSDPGLTESALRLGVLLPNQDKPGGPADVVERVLRAFFEDLNGAGGIYNRQVDLRFARAGHDPEETAKNLARLVEEDEVFALASAFVQGAEKPVAALLQKERVPLIGAITDYPDEDAGLDRYVFHLLGGLPQQVSAMVDYGSGLLAARARQHSERTNAAAGQITILAPDHERFKSVAAVAARRVKPAGSKSVQSRHYPAGQFDGAAWAKQLRQEGAQIVILLGMPEEQAIFLKEAARLEWAPVVFIPGALLARGTLEAAAGFQGQIFTSLPRALENQSAQAVAAFRSMAARHGIPSQHQEAQIAAYCAAKVLVAALENAGQQLDREKLTVTLEQLRDFDTGLTPLISFGPFRRVGAPGAYIASVAPATRQLIPVSGWIRTQ
jgi:ABC-type branched-subunit amino acid transport system substrate-binding protein